MRSLTAVIAADRNGCIGRQGSIPWHFSEDLRFFKQTTSGGAIVMGRRTWDSLPKKPLPKRVNIVLSRRPAPTGGPEPHHWISSSELEAVLADLPADQSVYLIGGAGALELLWEHIDEFLLTRVDLEVEDGDTFLPDAFARDFERVEEVARLSPMCRVERYRRRSG